MRDMVFGGLGRAGLVERQISQSILQGGRRMDTLADYEKWKATRQESSGLHLWLQNADAAIVATEPDRTSQLPAQALLFAAIGTAVYLAFRYRSRIKSAVKFMVVAAIIRVMEAVRYVQQEASDIKTQVSHGLQSDPRDGRTALTIAKQDHATGRLHLAGRMFFNLAIAPLLLGGIIVGMAVIARLIGFFE